MAKQPMVFGQVMRLWAPCAPLYGINHRNEQRNPNRNPKLRIHNKLFERIWRVVLYFTSNRWNHGKHRYLL